MNLHDNIPNKHHESISSDPSLQSTMPSQKLVSLKHWMLSSHFVKPDEQLNSKTETN